MEKSFEGWKNLSMLMASTNRGHSIIRKELGLYRKSHPEWFKNFREQEGQVCEFISPELVSIIETKLSVTKKPSEDWKTINSLVISLKRSPGLINKIIEPYRITHPEWFRGLRGSSNVVNEHLSPELISIIEKELSDEINSEGWKKIKTLSSSNGVSPYLIYKIIEPYRKTHPEWFKDLRGERGHVSKHISSELVLIVEAELSGENLPEGWRNVPSLEASTGRSSGFITRVAESYRKSHPEWFGNFRKKGAKFAEYFSPELVSVIEMESLKLERPPEGWKTFNELVISNKRASDFIRGKLEPYRKTHPEWFRNFGAKNGNITEHFSPELLSVINFESLNVGEPPEGWKYLESLSIYTEISQRFIKQIVEPYRQTHPEWFKYFRIESGHIIEHFSPKLVSIIESESLKIEKSPDGWNTRTSLALLNETSLYLISKIVEPYRQTHPEWFKDFRGENGKVSEHYSPELGSIIPVELSKVDQPPEGWKNSFQVSLSLNRSYYLINRGADRYRQTHPEWFKDFRGENGKVSEHYSPELILILKKEAEGFQKNNDKANLDNHLVGFFEKIDSSKEGVELKKAHQYLWLIVNIGHIICHTP